jgi:trehalose/maltose hydrolase-like predicted phosphorylase
MGSVWQALAYGFLGAGPNGEVLRLDPRLPPAWDAFEVRLRFRGARLRARVTGGRVDLVADRPVRVSVGASLLTVDSHPRTCVWEPPVGPAVDVTPHRPDPAAGMRRP